MKILAIDPGVEKVGYSVFNKHKEESITFDYITSGLIKTSRNLSHEKRLEYIYNKLQSIITTHEIQHIVMEQLFFFKNAKTVISVAQAQGAIQLLAAQRNIPLEFITPLQIKQIITGDGHADKQAVRKMIGLSLTEKIEIGDDDESDAIACGLAYCYLNDKLR